AVNAAPDHQRRRLRGLPTRLRGLGHPEHAAHPDDRAALARVGVQPTGELAFTTGEYPADAGQVRDPAPAKPAGVVLEVPLHSPNAPGDGAAAAATARDVRLRAVDVDAHWRFSHTNDGLPTPFSGHVK